MSEYFAGALALCAVMCVLRLALYRGREDFAVRLAFSVLTIFALVSPLSDIIANMDNNIQFSPELPDTFDGEYETVAENAFREGIKQLVCTKFDLPESGVRVLISDFDFQVMRAGRVRIFLSGRAVLADYKAIEKMIESEGLGECDVELEIG